MRIVPWLLLVVSLAALVFQVFPSLFWLGCSALDVRGWTWRSYSVAFTAAIVVLVAIRARQNRG